MNRLYQFEDLRVLLDSAPAMIGYWDAQEIHRYANRTYNEWLNAFGSDIVGVSLRDVFGDQYESLVPHVRAALDGVPQRFTRDENDRYVDVQYVPHVRDGVVVGVMTIVTDVSDLHYAAQQVRQQNQLMRMAEEVADIGHWRFDVETGSLYWSPTMFRIHGHDASHTPTVESMIHDFHDDDREKFRILFDHVVAKKESFSFAFRIVRPDGEIRHVHGKIRYEADADTVTGLFGVVNDVTEYTEMRERVIRQDRLVTTGTLASGVGHEINNPLTYLSSNIDFVIDELRTIAGGSPAGRMKEIVKILGEAKEGAERIRKIVLGLRAFAREEVTVVPTDVVGSLELSVNMAMYEIRQRASVVYDLMDVPPVMADDSRLSQVFVNLLVNAAQSFETKDPQINKVTVRTRRIGDRVCIDIEDNGPGIPDAILPRIFDPFFTTKPIGEGTGLGLSICQSIVTSLGGDIVCSRLTRGTGFRVCLPVATTGSKAPEVQVPSAPQVGQRRGRILVVDDEDHVSRAIERLLAAEHDVTIVSDVRDAQARLLVRVEDYDVIFCDLMMPHVTGMDLFRQVVQERPDVARRFVFITGGATSEQISSFLNAVSNDRIDKPFSNSHLKRLTRRRVDAG